MFQRQQTAFLVLVSVLLAALACKGDKKAAEKRAEPEAINMPAPPPPPPPPPVESNLPDPKEWKISGTAVGPLDKSMNTKEALEAALPGYQVEKTSYQAEGDTYENFLVRKEHNVFFTIYPGTAEENQISSALILSEHIASPAGFHIGDSVDKLAEAGELDCFLAAESDDEVLCRLGDDQLIQYKFTEISGLKPGKKITAKELKGATVTALRWLPEMPE